jgi:hypothetical protein
MEKELSIKIMNEIFQAFDLNANKLSQVLKMNRAQGIYDVMNPNKLNVGISKELSEKICAAFPAVNKAYLLTGIGSLFESEPTNKKLIPFYDDVSSIGGNNEMVASTDGQSLPTDYIDAGDWFKDATAAIRHYGESMIEYPTGCVLALKEVQDRELIIPGRDYTIETSEYRVTKRIQKGKSEKHITAYSTNSETYADGRLIHEPFDIPWRAINRISLVLGYVVKKNGGTIVFNTNKK